MIEIRRAVESDREQISLQLDAAGLPSSDIATLDLRYFHVAIDAGRVVGCVGLEICGRDALFRSLAVLASQRRRGIADRLCTQVESGARSAGVCRLFLLTKTAGDFFRRRGWLDMRREDVPPAIAATDEFSSLCPDDAVCLFRTFRD
jgi:amino-acid N-acetyltransferase